MREEENREAREGVRSQEQRTKKGTKREKNQEAKRAKKTKNAWESGKVGEARGLERLRVGRVCVREVLRGEDSVTSVCNAERAWWSVCALVC